MSTPDATLRLQSVPRHVLNPQTMWASESNVLFAFRGLLFFTSCSWPALSATSRVMRGDASYSRWERPFAMILGCLDISVARSTRCVHRLCRALSPPSPRGRSRPPDRGLFLEKCRKSDAKSAYVHQNAREAARFHRTHHLHIALSISSSHYDFRCFMCGLNTVIIDHDRMHTSLITVLAAV